MVLGSMPSDADCFSTFTAFIQSPGAEGRAGQGRRVKLWEPTQSGAMNPCVAGARTHRGCQCGWWYDPTITNRSMHAGQRAELHAGPLRGT